MSFVLVFAIWLILGWAVYRAHKHARTMSAERVPVDRSGELDAGLITVDIPDTVPPEWVDSYRPGHGS